MKNRKEEKEISKLKLTLFIISVDILIFFLSWGIFSEHGLGHTIRLLSYLGIFAVYIISLLSFNEETFKSLGG